MLCSTRRVEGLRGLRLTAASLIFATFALPATAQTPVRTHRYDSTLESLTFSPSGKGYALSASGNDCTELFETESGKVLRRLRRGDGWTAAIGYSPDERLFASGMVDNTRAGESAAMVRVWDLSNGNVRLELPVSASDIRSLAFSPKGKLLAAGQRDGTVRVWGVENGKDVANLRGRFVDPLVAFAGADEDLITAGEGGKIFAWDTKQFKLRKTLANDAARPVTIAYSAEKKALCTAGDVAGVQFWMEPRWAKGKKVEFADFGSGINPPFKVAALAPDGDVVAATDGIGVSVWEISTGKRIGQYKHPRGYIVKALSVSRDGKMVLSGASHPVSGETEVVLWSITK